MRYVSCQYFLLFHRWLFYFINTVLRCIKVFNVAKANVRIFLLLLMLSVSNLNVYCWIIHGGRSLPTPEYDLSLRLYPKPLETRELSPRCPILPSRLNWPVGSWVTLHTHVCMWLCTYVVSSANSLCPSLATVTRSQGLLPDSGWP